MKRSGKKLHKQPLTLGAILRLILVAFLVAGAGIGYAMLKNEQIQVSRDIKQLNDEIAYCELTQEYYRSQNASKTSRWALRDRLSQDKSGLQPIEQEAIEYVGTKEHDHFATNNTR